MIGDYLLVAINGGARDAVLRVYTIEPNRSDKPDPWLKLVQEIQLGGHLQMSPLVEGQRVLVTTNSGVVRVFELSATDVKTPLREVANTAIEGGGNLTRFALMQNGQFWIADNRLTKYDVQAARGRLMPKSIDCVDSAFLQPPVAIGQAVVSVRRKLGMPGAIVSALAMQESNTFWETRIASPLAGEPLVMDADGKNDGKLVAVTANGGAFKIDANQSGSAVANDPIVASDSFRSQATHQLRRPARRGRAGHQRRQGGRPDRRLRAGKRHAADALAESARRARLCAGRAWPRAAGALQGRPGVLARFRPKQERRASNWPSRSSRGSSPESISTG